ncbi:hypothetical protein GGF46_001679 [Coemansia sp. RSA 552]|nr:hypothetical protein GGF46_001679 [Coemansia sp. RSA 552]
MGGSGDNATTVENNQETTSCASERTPSIVEKVASPETVSAKDNAAVIKDGAQQASARNSVHSTDAAVTKDATQQSSARSSVHSTDAAETKDATQSSARNSVHSLKAADTKKATQQPSARSSVHSSSGTKETTTSVAEVPAGKSARSSNVADEEISADSSDASAKASKDEHEDDADARDEDNLANSDSILASMTLARRIMTMSALSLSIFIGSIEQTIVASSIPAIAENFDAMGSISWVATAFFLASTAMQPLYGRLSDIFGRVETLITGLVIFLVGSAVCGAAQSMGMLIGGRVIQGLGASALLSLVMVIVSDISIERERGKVASVFSAIWAASSVLGPILGGVFTESSGGWRWVFYFSLPVGGVAGVFIVFFLRMPRPQGSFMEKLRRIDFVGMIVLVGGLIMILLALNFGGQDYSWSSPVVICLLVCGLVVIGIFVLLEWKVPKEPVMPMRLFKDRNVTVALLQNIFMGATLFGPPYYIPLYFTATQNSAPIAASLHLLPFLLPITILSVFTGFGVSKTGHYREFEWVGSAITTAGICLLMLLDENASTGKSIGILIVPGIGLGMLMQPLLLSLQTAIQARDIATGTTLFVAMRSLGGSIGLAVYQTVQLNTLRTQLEPIYQAFADHKDIIEASVNNPASIYYDGVPSDLRDELVQAYVKSLRTVFYAMIPFAAGIFLLSLCLKHIPLRTKMAKTAANTLETKDAEKKAE